MKLLRQGRRDPNNEPVHQVLPEGVRSPPYLPTRICGQTRRGRGRRDNGNFPAHGVRFGTCRHAGQGRPDANRLVHAQRERHARYDPHEGVTRLPAGVSTQQPARAVHAEGHAGAGSRHRVGLGRSQDLAVQAPKGCRVSQRQVTDRPGLHLLPEPSPGREFPVAHQAVHGHHYGAEGGRRLARGRHRSPERRLSDVPRDVPVEHRAGRLRRLRQPRGHRSVHSRQLPARDRHAGKEESQLPPRGLSSRRRGGELRYRRHRRACQRTPRRRHSLHDSCRPEVDPDHRGRSEHGDGQYTVEPPLDVPDGLRPTAHRQS